MENENQTPHKRRVHYKGKYPKKFEEKYKELQPEKYKDTIAHVIQKGNTPAGMHISIMVKEILDFLQIKPGQTGFDATLGYGGHTKAMLEQLQGQGHIVAMTGDGANDAPALQAADIGVAMGRRGTDAARQASAMVLADDNFATIAQAVRWGRVAYDNIKKALLFVLPTNVAQALVVAIALAAGWSLPISATQILWVNLVTAVTLAIAVAFEMPEPDVMQRPPRPPVEPLVTGAMAWRVVFIGVLICLLSYGAYGISLVRELGEDFARTAATHTLVCAEVVYLFSCRRFVASGWSLEVLRGNPALWPVIGVLALLQLAFIYAPPLQLLFRTAALDAFAWAYALAGALAAFAVVEVEKAVLRRMGRVAL